MNEEPASASELSKLTRDLAEGLGAINDGFVSTFELKRAVLQTLGERFPTWHLDFFDSSTEGWAEHVTKMHRKDKEIALMEEILANFKRRGLLWRIRWAIRL
jgi:hypothetical protein